MSKGSKDFKEKTFIIFGLRKKGGSMLVNNFVFPVNLLNLFYEFHLVLFYDELLFLVLCHRRLMFFETPLLLSIIYI